jgi:phosphinothricin acetyltransferase
MGTIRIAREEDAQDILNIYQNYIIGSAVSFETVVPSIVEMRDRIRHCLNRHCWLVWEEEGKVGGYAYASQHRERAAYRWAVDVSIYIGEKWHGKGIGKALYLALFSIIKLQGYTNAYSCICLPNLGSEKIHESFGFKKIAHFNKVGFKLGQWWDVGWWELFLQDKNGMPSEPIPINQINVREIMEFKIE